MRIFFSHFQHVHFRILAYETFAAEYEILRKAILENNVNITKRIINDLNVDKEKVINFTPKEDNSLLFMYVHHMKWKLEHNH